MNMKVEDVMKCNFSAWYNTFEDVTIPSIVLPLPVEFVGYLHADTVVLPEGSHQGAYVTANANDDSEDDQQIDWSSDGPCKEVKMPENCQGFLQEVDAAISLLGGKVFPKLNWSAPQDASWVSLNNSLQCTHASDVCLLFKSSDFITRDLTQPFIHCEDGDVGAQDVVVKHEMVLRQWQDINTSHEFRCFVRDNKLIGICQRSVSKFFKHIVESRQEIQDEIEEFFTEVIDCNFAEGQGLSYTFDVWRKKKHKLILLDFNPFGPITDPLLFSWEDLESYDTSQGLMFRCVESENGVQPNPMAQFGVPTDIVDLTAGLDPYKLLDLMKLCEQGTESSSEDEEGKVAEENTDVSTER